MTQFRWSSIFSEIQYPKIFVFFHFKQSYGRRSIDETFLKRAIHKCLYWIKQVGWPRYRDKYVSSVRGGFFFNHALCPLQNRASRLEIKGDRCFRIPLSWTTVLRPWRYAIRFGQVSFFFLSSFEDAASSHRNFGHFPMMRIGQYINFINLPHENFSHDKRLSFQERMYAKKNWNNKLCLINFVYDL